MTHDIIVIGAGSGGLNISSFMNKAGFKVLLINKTDKTIGGDCLNFGCVPSKAIIHLSKLAKQAKESTKFGLKISGKINMTLVHKYIHNKIEYIRTHENADYFRKRGMDVELGEAVFHNKNSITVNNKKYSAKKIIIATGSKPRKLKLKGIEKVKFLTNENIFDLKKLPKDLLVIGGGPIGVELGQAFSNLGTKVTIIQNSSNFLPKENSQITKILYNQLVKDGVNISFNTSPVEFTSKNELIINKSGKKQKLKFDQILVSIGRELNLPNGLEKAQIKTKQNKILKDNYLRTTNKNVFLCGDIAGDYMFTHAAELHTSVILTNFFSPIKKKLSYNNFSWVTYTTPEIATFGLNETQLKEKNIKFETLTEDFKDDDRAIVDNSTYGKIILYINKNKILGGTMIAENAGELIQELILANSSNLKINKIFSKIYPYPTASRINKKAISTHFSKKLTQGKKKILKFLYH